VKRRGLKVKTGVRAPAPFFGIDRTVSRKLFETPAAIAAFDGRLPVGLAGIANMVPLVVGPRCVVDPPCGSCWFCKTWEDRKMLQRFTGTPR